MDHLMSEVLMSRTQMRDEVFDIEGTLKRLGGDTGLLADLAQLFEDFAGNITAIGRLHLFHELAGGALVIASGEDCSRDDRRRTIARHQPTAASGSRTRPPARWTASRWRGEFLQQ